MNWNDCEIFCNVVEHGGFSAAGNYLGQPKSSISSAVQRLEQELDTRLLERTTRSVRVTEAGDILYQRTAHLFTRLREACDETLTSGREVAGLLRIAAPYEFGAHHVGPVASKVMAAYPGLQVHLEVEHRPINPLTEPYDIVFAMLESALPASTVVIRRMFSLERGLFAAPELVRTLGHPHSPDELRQWPLLASTVDTQWSFADQHGIDHHVPIKAARIVSNNADFRVQAAIAGLGVTRVTATFCAPQLASGALVRLPMPGYACEPLRVYALLPGKRLVPEKVRHFLDALAAYARTQR